MVQSYASGNACCFSSDAPGVDPTSVENVVMAGAVGSQNACGMPGAGSCALATVYFPTQVYRAGFCPCEALSRGTLFPELVSDYPSSRRGAM